MLCPQCKISSFYVKNANGERRLVYVTAEGEVVPKRPEESLEGFLLPGLLVAWGAKTCQIVRLVISLFQMMPKARATRQASIELPTRNFSRIAWRWRLTVLMLITSASATRLLVIP